MRSQARGAEAPLPEPSFETTAWPSDWSGPLSHPVPAWDRRWKATGQLPRTPEEDAQQPQTPLQPEPSNQGEGEVQPATPQAPPTPSGTSAVEPMVPMEVEPEAPEPEPAQDPTQTTAEEPAPSSPSESASSSDSEDQTTDPVPFSLPVFIINMSTHTAHMADPVQDGAPMVTLDGQGFRPICGHPISHPAWEATRTMPQWVDTCRRSGCSSFFSKLEEV